ncbi:hypothetical protein MsAc7_09230 [Methanolapillus millepedarum]|uniref:Uncharacterized protein n=1 Tax=Methanolapillus millepedarum TaxID=3028296 RepID=A0AA97A3W7_9EURY|nr:hypothetical protein MsAc7_09230 [Methanosarcinaceae archaeon Ac7]
MIHKKIKYLIIISFIFFMTMGLPLSNGLSSEDLMTLEETESRMLFYNRNVGSDLKSGG